MAKKSTFLVNSTVICNKWEFGVNSIVGDKEIEKKDREEKRRKRECFNILIRKEYHTLILHE